jgi:hypothetical protein
MNNRELKAAAKAYQATGDEAAARRMAFVLSSATRLPKLLREPLQAVALACLRCETAEAMRDPPSFPELYRAREAALHTLAQAVVGKVTGAVPDTWNATGDTGSAAE